MNKVILMGRLTRDPEIRYTQGTEPRAVARYTLAVDRRFKRDNQQNVDFLHCVAFGKNGEFAEKFLKQGMKINVVGSVQTGSYTDNEGIKRTSTTIIVEEHYFAESRQAYENRIASESDAAAQPSQSNDEGFVNVNVEDNDLPF